jgi:biotin carboxyl carrier protein
MVALAEMAYQGVGYRRIKNPRIWSLHDLAVLTRGRVTSSAPVDGQTGSIEKSADPVQVRDGLTAVTTPMDGSFWRRTAPGAAPLAEVGAMLEKGDPVGLIEVMKTYTPLRSPVQGELIAFEKKDGDSVQASQAVAWIRPSTPTS